MIIEFPKRFSVRRIIPGMYSIEVPREFFVAAVEMLKRQPWIINVFHENDPRISVNISRAYEISEAQAQDALERICAAVMEPDVPMDGALTDELESLLEGEDAT